MSSNLTRKNMRTRKLQLLTVLAILGLGASVVSGGDVGVAQRSGDDPPAVETAGGGLARPAIGSPVANSDTVSIVEDPDDPNELPDYGKPNQHRQWFNSYQQRWDALIPKNDGNFSSASDHYILLDVTGAQTFTGVELENRNTARPDTYWDDAAATLYVLGSHHATPRFWRVVYDPAGDTYTIDPGVDAVTVSGLLHAPLDGGGSDDGYNRPATMIVSPNGRVWASVMRDGALEVQHSTDGGATWLAAPVNLDPGARLGVTTWVRFEHAGRNFVALFAGENGEDGLDTRFLYWYIDENDDPTVLSNWTDDSASIPAAVGIERADDHVSGATDPRHYQYFAVKTEGGNPEDPLIRLFRRTASGTWSAYTITRTEREPEHTRPSVVVDAPGGRLMVFTTRTAGGDGRRVTAPLNRPDLLEGSVRRIVVRKTGENFDDVISPRSVTATSGLLLLAHNETAKQVWYNFLPPSPISECISNPGGEPLTNEIDLPSAGGNVALTATLWRPDPGRQDTVCPLVVLVLDPDQPAGEAHRAAERLAREGHVVAAVEPDGDDVAAFERALRAAIDTMGSSVNPWLGATDVDRVRCIAGNRAGFAIRRQGLAAGPRWTDQPVTECWPNRPGP